MLVGCCWRFVRNNFCLTWKIIIQWKRNSIDWWMCHVSGTWNLRSIGQWKPYGWRLESSSGVHPAVLDQENLTRKSVRLNQKWFRHHPPCSGRMMTTLWLMFAEFFDHCMCISANTKQLNQPIISILVLGVFNRSIESCNFHQLLNYFNWSAVEAYPLFTIGVGFRFYAERIGSVFLFQSDYHHPPNGGWWDCNQVPNLVKKIKCQRTIVMNTLSQRLSFLSRLKLLMYNYLVKSKFLCD